MNNVIALVLLDVAFVIDLNDYQWSVFDVQKFFFSVFVCCVFILIYV
jgi:hypothetical protein